MTVYECPNPSCQRRFVGKTQPTECGWCRSAYPVALGAASDPFDPQTYLADVRARPESYGRIGLMATALAERRKVSA